MARKNAREKKGSRKAAGGRKAAGAREAAGSRKAGSRKSAGGRKNTRAKSEAREMARTSRAGARKPASGRTGRASTRRAAGRTGAARKTSRARATMPRSGQSKRGDSASTQRALWVESPDQHADRPGQTLATRDHGVIRQWAEERGAVPATVAGTEHDGRPGVLRFDFPNFARGGGRLRQVDWDEWFETFDQRNLVFLFQEQVKRGNQSNFFRLDSPDREEA